MAPKVPPKLGARRAVQRTIPEIVAYVDTQLRNLPDDYMVLITVDDVPIDRDGLASLAQPGSKVVITSEHCTDKAQRREDPFIVASDRPSREDEVSSILRELREQHRDYRQTIGDMHTIIRAQNESLLKQTKMLGKFMKRTSKSFDKAYKLKKALRERDEESSGILADLRRELGDELMGKVLGKVVGHGLDFFGGQKRAGSDPGGGETVPTTSAESADCGPDSDSKSD